MQVECLKNILLEKVSLLQGAVNKNLTLPILNNVLLATESGRLKLAATNLELGITALVGGKISEEGSITVPIKLLINVLSNIISENIVLKTDQNRLIIEGEKIKTVINGIDSGGFPIIPKIEDGFEITVISEKLKKTFSQTIFSAAINDMRPELAGIFMEVDTEGDLINFVGTNIFRLAKSSLKYEGVNNKDKAVNTIIPSKTASEVLKCAGLAEAQSKISIRIADNQILFNLSNNISIISRIIEGQFPPYSQIIPKNYKTRIVFNKSNLIKLIKMAGIFASEKAMEIKIKQIDGNNIEINSSSQNIGENSSLISADIIGGKIEELTLSYKYILEGISAVNSEKVCFSINDSNTPIVIASGDDSDEDYLYLMMPLR